jgi:hypothetical protein
VAWISSFVFVVCCVGRGLCDELITCSEECYRLCVIKFNLEISKMRRPRPDLGYSTTLKEKYVRELGVCYLLRGVGCNVYDILGVYLYSLFLVLFVWHSKGAAF